jgi:hypothetical protein
VLGPVAACPAEPGVPAARVAPLPPLLVHGAVVVLVVAAALPLAVVVVVPGLAVVVVVLGAAVPHVVEDASATVVVVLPDEPSAWPVPLEPPRARAA